MDWGNPMDAPQRLRCFSRSHSEATRYDRMSRRRPRSEWTRTAMAKGYPQLMNAPGSETGPGPQLVTWGKSTILSVDAHGFKFDYTLNSAKHIPFDWEGP